MKNQPQINSLIPSFNLNLKAPLYYWLAAFFLLQFSLFGAVELEFVNVGNAGNSADSTGLGAVSYEFAIGADPVTNEAYAAFLNAVAQTDPMKLYNTAMATSPHGGIERSGSNGNYTYAVKSGFAKMPVNILTFWSAARFANWMTNGQPNGTQDATTTETGVYLLGSEINPLNNSVTRDFSAWQNGGYAIANENEWYKSAYYDPSLNNEAGGYWLYATRSNEPPVAAAPGTAESNVANSQQIVNSVTEVDAYPGAISFYGTRGQAGNVWDWTETVVDNAFRRVRGGSYTSWPDNFVSTYDGPNSLMDPSRNWDPRIGFRLVRFVSAGGGGDPDPVEPEPWGGIFEKSEEGFVNTGNWLGWLYIKGDHAYCYNLQKWLYLPSSFVSSAGSWAYVFRPLPEPEPFNPQDPRLSWSPPVLEDPLTLNVPVGGGTLTLQNGRDYMIIFPDEPVTAGVNLVNGRNIVVIGGEISIPHQGENPSINSRRALFLNNQTGTVHIEGLLMHGDDISEGIQIRAPYARVQIQNCAVYNMHARDQIGFTDNHPDLIQTWGNVGELYVDKFTGQTDYQGILLKADANGRHGPVHIRRMNILGDPTARYIFWMSDSGGAYPKVTLEHVYYRLPAERNGGVGKAVWPDKDNAQTPAVISTDSEGTHASWPSLPVTGRLTVGDPEGGDYVPFSAIGIGYTSPGYLE